MPTSENRVVRRENSQSQAAEKRSLHVAIGIQEYIRPKRDNLVKMWCAIIYIKLINTG